MPYTKHIKFVYFQLFQNDLKTKELFSMVEIISKLQTLDLKSRIEIIEDDKYRLENIETETRNGIDFFHLRFMKLDEANIPNLSFENDNSVPLTLKDGQYLGTALHVLYDITNEIFMIQQNRASMTIKKLNQYINQWAHKFNLVNNDELLEFLPIASRKGLNGKNEYTKICLNFANIQNADIPDNTALHELINFYNKYDGLSGSIVISLGHNTSKQLKSEEVNNLSEEINDNRELFKKAKIHYKTADYSGFVDLIEDIIHDTIRFDIEKRSSLTLISAQDGMLKRYLTRVNEILQELAID